jgi:hypothetical protein
MAYKLPQVHPNYFCEIRLKEGYELPKPSKPIPLSRPKKLAMEGFKKGTLRKSNSSVAKSTFMVSKKGGDLRPVVDYHLINEIVIDTRTPIPCIDEVMTYLTGARVFDN